MRRRAAAATPAVTPTPTPNEAKVVQAIDQELEWYFTYAEGARRTGAVTLLPTRETTRLVAASTSEEGLLDHAGALALKVQCALGEMKPPHAGVLRAAYTPRRWPRAVTREFEGLTPIVVRLVCAVEPWPARTSAEGLERAAAKHLLGMLVGNAAQPAVLRKQAGRLMANAVSAYMRARAKGGVACESHPS